MSINRIAVLGDGGWGTALSLVLARKGFNPTLWSAFPEHVKEFQAKKENTHFLAGIPLPNNINFSSDLEKTVTTHDLIVVAIPTVYVRSTLARLTKEVLKEKVIVSCTKGIENSTLQTPLEIISELTSHCELVALSGPSHAEEVAKAVPTCVVVASYNERAALEVQETFMEPNFRVYTSKDVIGVELGGALKNVVALASGICDGLGFGSNTKAALISRGVQEIQRLGVALGAQSETFFGLSGMGDLVTTCFSAHGRNRKVGERIGKGEQLEEIVKSMKMVAEGVKTSLSAYRLAQKHSIDMPIIAEVYHVLYEGKDPKQSINDLMMRDSKNEML